MEELPNVVFDPAKETPSARTSKHIAYWLLALYSSALLFMAAFAGILEVVGRGSEIWFDLFKSGFLILGGALSTVVGYYFGSRGIQEAEANAQAAGQRAKAAESELAAQKVETRQLQDRNAPTPTEEAETDGGLQIPPSQGTGT